MLNPARPFFWLLTYLVILYLRPQEYVPTFVDTPLVPVSLLFAAAVWLIGQEKRFNAPQHGLMLALVAMMMLSVLASGWVGGAVKVFTQFVPTLLVYFLVSTSVDSLKRLREICLLLSVMSVVMVVHGMEQIAAEDGIGWTGAATIKGRITYLGLLNDPNDLSMVFLMGLPLTLYLAASTGSFVLRYACLAAAAATLYGIYLCNSRGSILALGAMLVLYVARRFGILLGAVMLPVLIGVLAFFSPSRMGEMSVDEASAAGRVDAWYAGFDMFFSHPLLGVGTGLFTDHNGLTAHNSFVLALSEMGLAGYYVWFALLALSGAMLWRLVTMPEPEPMPAQPAPVDPQPGQLLQPEAATSEEPGPSWTEIQRAAVALGYAYVGTLVAAFFLSRTYIVFIYLLIGLVVALHQMAGHHWPTLPPMRMGSNWVALLAAAIASIGGLWVLTHVLLSLA